MSSKSSLALQWSIEKLLKVSYRPCGFYLVTCAQFLPWSEFSRRHAVMIKRMRTDAWRKQFPRFAGVRVFEEGEETNRPHAHWVFTPRVSQDRLQAYATMAGLGHVWRDYRPAGQYLPNYLAKYLSKSDAIRGVRRWSCFGEFDGYKVADVEIYSEEVEKFRQHFKSAMADGMSRQQAFVEARRKLNLSKYGMLFDTEAGIPTTPARQDDGEVDITTVMNDGTVTRQTNEKHDA